MSGEKSLELQILAPCSGKVIPLKNVKDPVFSQGMLGPGCAIVPQSGEIYVPVDGEVTTIAKTKHALGIKTASGVEILVHFGLETVKLDGSAFDVKVKEGQKVKAGDLFAIADLDALKKEKVDLTTPVLICDTSHAWDITLAKKNVQAKEELFDAKELAEKNVDNKEAAAGKAAGNAAVEEAQSSAVANKDKAHGSKDASSNAKAQGAAASSKKLKKKKRRIAPNFDLLQRFGKTLIAVIVVMPAAGLLISIGKLVAMLAGDASFVVSIGTVMETMGWGIINNLNILFALAIGGSWAKERAGGAFAAMVAFIIIAVITGSAFGVTADVLNNANLANPVMGDPKLPLTVMSAFGQPLNVQAYFTFAAGIPCLNMGVFIGIISGFLGGVMFNKYYNFKKLPPVLTFFNGKRFVPIVTIGYATLVALVICIFWPFAQSGINAFGAWVVGSQESAPFIAPFIYGTTERLLLPFGLHHMLTIPLNYSSLGGVYQPIDGSAAVMGQDPIWLAWVSDLGKALKEGNMDLYNQILHSQTPGRFKVGQVIGSSAMLIGFAVAIYKRAEIKHKKIVFSLIFSAAAATILTGVTEPLEFMFMFAATPLYVVYAIIQGVCFGMADVVPMRLSAFGDIELVTRMPMGLQAGLWMDYVWFAIMCAIFFVVGYGVSYWLIGKFNFATPGRNGNYPDAPEKEDAKGAKSGKDSTHAAGTSGSPRVQAIIELLGGPANIDLVDACMTRLRVTVVDPEKVEKSEDVWKSKTRSLGLIEKGEGIQIVYGPEADALKNDVNEALGR